MKTLLYISTALLSFVYASAQTAPKNANNEKQVAIHPKGDSLSTNSQITKESDLKTMDAVKTQDHKKTVRQETITSKDTVTTQKDARTGSKKPTP